MRLEPRKKYIDEFDGTIKTGSAWMKYFKEQAKQYVNDLLWDFKRIGREPEQGEIPTPEEQEDWIFKNYTSFTESDHHLKEYKSEKKEQARMTKKNFEDLIDTNTHKNEDGAIANIISTPANEKPLPAGIVVEHLNKPIIKPNMLTSEEVERITGMSDKTIAKYLRIGRIKAVKIGTKWQVHPDDLNDFLAGKIDEDWMAKCVEREAARKARRKPRVDKPKAVEA